MIFHNQFSETKLEFAIVKATLQYGIRKYLGTVGYAAVGKPFEHIADRVFRAIL